MLAPTNPGACALLPKQPDVCYEFNSGTNAVKWTLEMGMIVIWWGAGRCESYRGLWLSPAGTSYPCWLSITQALVLCSLSNQMSAMNSILAQMLSSGPGRVKVVVRKTCACIRCHHFIVCSGERFKLPTLFSSSSFLITDNPCCYVGAKFPGRSCFAPIFGASPRFNYRC